MTWSKMSDDWPDHPKVLMCSDPAVALWLRSIAYANRHLTDGFVPESMLPKLSSHRHVRSIVRELVECIPPTYSRGLWEPVEGGWMIHGFLDYSPSRQEVMARRAADAERQSRHRSQCESRPVSQRDNTRESHSDKRMCHTPPVPTRPHTDPEIPPTPLASQEGNADGSRKRSRTGPRTIRTLLPREWTPTLEHFEQAKTEGGRNAGWVQDQAERMRDYAAGKGWRMADWDATFRNWIRKALDSRPSLVASAEPDPSLEAARRIAQTNALTRDRIRHVPRPVHVEREAPVSEQPTDLTPAEQAEQARAARALVAGIGRAI
ncbi:MAG: hypothetical protein WC683_09370 [bacterium]